MRILLKKIVSNNIFLYYLWFILVRKRKGLDVNFFSRKSDVYIDGYARSGNTFIIHLVELLLPKLNVVHHLHAVAPIKVALKMHVPVFILLRNPMDCISSKYLKYFAMKGLEVETDIDDCLLNEFIYDYLNYYQFIKENKKKIHIINFDHLIEAPEEVIFEIQAQLRIKKKLLRNELTEAVRSYKGATDIMGSSKPNPKKEKYKSLVKEYIVQSDKYPEIMELFNSIVIQS